MTEKNCTLLFLLKDDQILLAMKKRGFGADRYNGIGGKIDPGETVEQALIRECQEEIEVTPTKFHKVAEHDFTQTENDSPWRMYVHAYLCTEWEGEPKETEEMAPELSESPSSSGSESELASSVEEENKWPPAISTSRRRRVPSGLLGNFEESALNGRLEPSSSAEGFRLQIGQFAK